jgi:hypothetical protein
MASTAPVTSTASVDMKFPRWGTAWRTSTSAPEQHMPAMLIPGCTRIFGGLNQRGFIYRSDHGLEQVGFVPVHDDVDLLFIQHPHINFDGDRGGRTKKDIRNLCSHHGPTPTIGECGSAGLLHDVVVILIDTHVRPMHHLHDLPHGPAGNKAQFAPGFQRLFRDSLHERNFTIHLGVGTLQLRVEFKRDILLALAFRFDANRFGN